MLATYHPNYVYRPRSQEVKRKLQILHRARYGCGPDQRMLFGVILHEDAAYRISPIICRLAQKISKDTAVEAINAYLAHGPWALRPYIRLVPNRLLWLAKLRKENAARKLKEKRKKYAAKRYQMERRIAARLERTVAKFQAMEIRRAEKKELRAAAAKQKAERYEYFRRRREEMSPVEREAASRREKRRAAWRRMSSVEKAAWWKTVHEDAIARRLAREATAQARAEKKARREKYQAEREARRLWRMRENTARAQRRVVEAQAQALRAKEKMERGRLRAEHAMEVTRRMAVISERRLLTTREQKKESAARQTKKAFALALHAEGMSHDEISSMVQMSPATVKNWVEEARTKKR